jgi:hypothetical protein
MEPRTETNEALRRHSGERLGGRLAHVQRTPATKRKLSHFEHLGKGRSRLKSGQWTGNGSCLLLVVVFEGFGRNSNLNVSALFESHTIAVFVD